MVMWVRIGLDQINKSGDNSGSFVSRGRVVDYVKQVFWKRSSDTFESIYRPAS